MHLSNTVDPSINSARWCGSRTERKSITWSVGKSRSKNVDSSIAYNEFFLKFGCVLSLSSEYNCANNLDPNCDKSSLKDEYIDRSLIVDCL